MKKLSLIVLSVFVTISLFGYTNVKSIAEIKTLSDGSLVQFDGEAITTHHQGDWGLNGILIQDENDAILLKHAYFCEANDWFTDPKENGYKLNASGTIVKSFSGKFRKATNTLPDRIEFTEEDLKYIESGSYGNPIPYKNITADELLADPEKYAMLVLSVVEDSVKKEGSGLYATTYSLSSDSLQMPINLSAAINGRSVPAGGTFRGICEFYAGKYRFTIPNRYYIDPTAFFNIVDLYNFVDDNNRNQVSITEISIVEPVLVNHVEQQKMNINYYIQSTVNDQTSALCVSVSTRGVAFQAAVGDSIYGLSGYYSKLALEDGLYKGSMLRIQERKFGDIKVLNSNNTITWQEQKVHNLLLTPDMFESRLISVPVGEFKNVKFIENTDTVERIAFVQYDGDLRKQYDTIRILMSGGKDLTEYLGTKAAIIGVYDLSEAIAAGYPTLLLRDEKDILRDMEFESIGAMLAAGKPLSTTVEYSIKNPVIVTYKYYSANTQGDNEHMCGLYLQDATGAILYKTGQPVDSVEVGDSIVGVRGQLQYNEKGHAEHYLRAQASTKLTVLNSNNELVPTEVTLDKIVDSPMDYAAKLIKIKNLELMPNFGIQQGYPYNTVVIYQNGVTLPISNWTEKYDDMNVVGIVEYNIMGSNLTIFPISIEEIHRKFRGECYRVSDIKKLEEGTEFTFIGNARTTFTDFENGLLIEDYTGGILLKNVKLSDNGDAKIASGTIVTNIKGKYYPAEGDLLSYIEIADEDINNIEVIAENVGFSVQNTDVNMIKEFYEYYEAEALLLRSPIIVKNDDGSYKATFTYTTTDGVDHTVDIAVTFKTSEPDLTKSDYYGYLRKFDGKWKFVVVSNEVAEYQSFEGEYDYDYPEPDSGEENAIENTLAKYLVYIADDNIIAQDAVAMQLFDVNGRLLIASETSQLNVSMLNNGVYIIKSLHLDGSSQITKIIK